MLGEKNQIFFVVAETNFCKKNRRIKDYWRDGHSLKCTSSPACLYCCMALFSKNIYHCLYLIKNIIIYEINEIIVNNK